MSYDNPLEQPGWAIYRVGQGILIEDGRVLLSGNRWYSNKPLVWTLPGGRAEEGEGVAEAAVREFWEETGLRVEVVDLAFVAEARSLARRRLFLTCAFTVRRVSGELPPASLSPQAGDAVEELRFVPFGELDAYLSAPSLRDPLHWYLEPASEGARYWFFPEYATES
jgi:ADP-ribose pyrophosphatase YjhB (NUDIX family)